MKANTFQQNLVIPKKIFRDGVNINSAIIYSYIYKNSYNQKSFLTNEEISKGINI